MRESVNMERVNAIWQHSLYQEELKKLLSLESDRVFCKHTPEHFMDVARLAYIYSLERGITISRELIYATALLHDIGRARQYTSGLSHEEAGARIAEQILTELDFSEEEIKRIAAAIRGHRSQADQSILGQLIYQADKKSRNCFLCPAQKECYWPFEKKNMTIQY